MADTVKTMPVAWVECVAMATSGYATITVQPTATTVILKGDAATIATLTRSNYATCQDLANAIAAAFLVQTVIVRMDFVWHASTDGVTPGPDFSAWPQSLLVADSVTLDEGIVGVLDGGTTFPDVAKVEKNYPYGFGTGNLAGTVDMSLYTLTSSIITNTSILIS